MKQPKSKAAYWLPSPMLAEMRGEAERLCRTLSYVAQVAVKLALPTLRAVPGPPKRRGE